MRWALRENQLACGTNRGTQQMAAMSGAVSPPDHQVRMNLRLAVFERDVANERKQLHLFVELHRGFIFLGVPVEPAQLYLAQCADRLETASGQVILPRHLFEHLLNLLPGLENHREGLRFIRNLPGTHSARLHLFSDADARRSVAAPTESSLHESEICF